MIFPYARRESGARERDTHTRTRSNAHTLLYLVLDCLNLQCVSVRITCQCTIKRAEDPRHVLHHRNIDLRGTCSLNLKHAVCVHWHTWSSTCTVQSLSGWYKSIKSPIFRSGNISLATRTSGWYLPSPPRHRERERRLSLPSQLLTITVVQLSACTGVHEGVALLQAVGFELQHCAQSRLHVEMDEIEGG